LPKGTHDGEGGDGEGKSDSPGAGVRDVETATPQQSALKVWNQRLFEDYDEEAELGVRNMKMALRRLRRFARESSELELDLDGTIRSTARNGGLLDIRMLPERRNNIKVLLMLDVGGSMDSHIELMSQLFTAARGEFKYLETFYFHNFLYESVWTNNDRGPQHLVSTLDLARRFPRDTKVIFVGDARMGLQEILEKGGSIEHHNAEAGRAWMNLIDERFARVAWMNPAPESGWRDSQSTELVRRIVDGQMYHLSVDGLQEAMKFLAR